MRLSWCGDKGRVPEKEWQILDDFVKASSLVTGWAPKIACFGALSPPCLGLYHSL
jgi:hypothetical protein